MSISKEYQEYHLTSEGWVIGSFKGDVFGGSDERPIPEDRVLTISLCDEIPQINVKPIYHVSNIWQSDNEKLISKLKLKFGDLPQDVKKLME